MAALPQRGAGPDGARDRRICQIDFRAPAPTLLNARNVLNECGKLLVNQA
jgi:hypothetical protein